MNRNKFHFPLALLIFLLLFSSCGGEEAKNPNTWPLTIRVDGVNYYYKLNMAEDYTVEDSQIMGYIISVVPITQGPAKDDEANFDNALNAPYARYSDDEYPDAILIPFGGCWHLFAPFEARQENS